MMPSFYPTVYCKWLKDFMEGGKGRLRGHRFLGDRSGTRRRATVAILRIY